LTSVTGYYDTGEETVFAVISDTVPVLGIVNTFSMNQITEELRLASDFATSPVNFMAGAFYQSAKQDVDTILRANQAFPLPPLLGWAPQTVNIESESLYGQAIWKIVPKLELAAGARWTDEDRTHRETNLDPISGPIGPVPLLDPRITSNNLSPEVSLTYTPTGELTLYGSFKEGYKSGSFNTVQYISPTAPTAFGDESVRGGELGAKSSMLDRSLLVDFDAYHYHYSQLQVGATTVTNDALAFTTVNAASAIVEGFDLDVAYAVPQIQGLTVRGATNYNKADFESFPNAPCGNGQTISQGCNQIFNPATGLCTAQSLGGRPLIRAPLWSGNLQFD
jgi:iron complex outermembrane recepter protein